MRRSTVWLLGIGFATTLAITLVPRAVLKHRYRDLLSEKKGRLLPLDGASLKQAVLVATWRSVWIGWQTSYSCDMQTVIRPDASGNFTIPDVSAHVDVGELWFSRILGTEADFSFDLFAYVPGYIPTIATFGAHSSAHAPWSLASLEPTPADVRLRPIHLQSVKSNPKQALDYYASYLPSLDCKPTEITEVTGVRRQAGHEALGILCAVEDPSAIDKTLASKIVARPIGLITPGAISTSETADLRELCESALPNDPK